MSGAGGIVLAMDGITSPGPARVTSDVEDGRQVQWVVCGACGWISNDQPSMAEAYAEAGRHNRRRHPAPATATAECA